MGLNRLLWELENSRWGRIPGFLEPRRELTRLGLQVFQEFVDEKSADPVVRFQAGRAYEILVNVHLVSREFAEADQAHRQAVVLFQQLLSEAPENPEYSLVLGRVRNVMGNWDFSRKLHAQAKEEYRGAIEALQKSLPFDRTGWIHNNLAFVLPVTCQEVELRDPKQAVALATRALAPMAPDESARSGPRWDWLIIEPASGMQPWPPSKRPWS